MALAGELHRRTETMRNALPAQAGDQRASLASDIIPRLCTLVGGGTDSLALPIMPTGWANSSGRATKTRRCTIIRARFIFRGGVLAAGALSSCGESHRLAYRQRTHHRAVAFRSNNR